MLATEASPLRLGGRDFKHPEGVRSTVDESLREPKRAEAFSPRWKEMLGYTEREVGHGAGEWFSRTHPDDRDRLGMAMGSAIDATQAGALLGRTTGEATC